MKGLLLTVAVIAIIAVVITRRGSGPATGSSPAPSAIADQISFRDQAGLELRVRAQIDSMKQLAAMGSTPPTVAPVLEANQTLIDDQKTIAERQRQAGGDASPPRNWEEFLRLDAGLRQPAP